MGTVYGLGSGPVAGLTIGSIFFFGQGWFKPWWRRRRGPDGWSGRPSSGNDATSDEDVLIRGEYGDSTAFRPTILLRLETPAAAGWLKDMLHERCHSVQRVDLAFQPQVRIRGVDYLVLIHRRGGHMKMKLYCTDPTPGAMRFEWSATSLGWENAAGLMEPFIEGTVGHQYLTSGESDDAQIGVSYGERSRGA
jgi:hypothetical protein